MNRRTRPAGCSHGRTLQRIGLPGHERRRVHRFGFAEFVSGIDALVMGRSTYEFIAPFEEWPYQGRPVHVLSATLAEGADPRITVHRSLDDAVAAIGSAGYRRVYVDGGRTVHAFLRAGLIADLTLSRVPVLIGTGHTPSASSRPTSHSSMCARRRFRAAWSRPPTGSALRPERSSSVGQRDVDRDLGTEARALHEFQVVAGPEAARVVGVERAVPRQ
jgi:hypothetical protein